MANTNPQAVLIGNEKIRPAADRLGQAYNYFKALQAEAQAENWTALFPADGIVLGDGSDVDGRTLITDTDISQFMTLIGSFITWMEATSNANRNLTLKIAVRPEAY